MSRSNNYTFYRNISDELREKMKKEGTHLFRYDLVDYFFVDKTIVKEWPDDPNSMWSSNYYSEVPLDRFYAVLDDYLNYLETTIKRIYDRNDGDRKIEEGKKNIEKAKDLIAPYVDEIRKREHDRDVNETTDRINRNFVELCAAIQHIREIGIDDNWKISRNDEVVFNTNPDQEIKL